MNNEEVQTTEAKPEQSQGRDESARGGKKMPRNKRKVCAFCADKVKEIDYKDVARLRKFVTEKGKIISRRQTGLCASHQREITNAVRRARNMSLL